MVSEEEELPVVDPIDNINQSRNFSRQNDNYKENSIIKCWKKKNAPAEEVKLTADPRHWFRKWGLVIRGECEGGWSRGPNRNP